MPKEIQSYFQKPSKTFDTKKEAVNYGRKVAKNNHVDLFVHDKEGRIKSRASY